MLPLNDRPLSALALATYQSCPLRYRYRYVDGLYWSQVWGTSPAGRRALERGQDFHLMARRFYAGLEPARVNDQVEQRELESWLVLLQGFLPFTLDQAFYPELELRLNRPGARLQAKFDLLVVEANGRATVFDWKTEQHLPSRSVREAATQTLLYRYMLCAAGGAYSPRSRFRPAEVAMVYWNPVHAHRWERLEYSEAQFLQDEQTLYSLIDRIDRTPREGFLPTTDERVCHRCEYQIICHGRPSTAVEPGEDEPPEDASFWDTLPELP